jgi:hypothetical protein
MPPADLPARLAEAGRECRLCRQWKSLGEFPRHRTSKGGYAARCRDCRNAQRREQVRQASPHTPVDGKTCGRCKAFKPASEFWPAPRLKLGVAFYCKECEREHRKRRRQTNVARYRERAREQYDRKVARGQATKGHSAAPVDPVKRRARNMAQGAIRRGIIVRPSSCQDCGKVGATHAHHEDYSRPLDVVFVCYRCHGRRHRKPLPQSAA